MSSPLPLLSTAIATAQAALAAEEISMASFIRLCPNIAAVPLRRKDQHPTLSVGSGGGSTAGVVNFGENHFSPKRRYSLRRQSRDDKIVSLMGPTLVVEEIFGLSVELAACFPGEIVICDKMQLHRGLGVTTGRGIGYSSACLHLAGVLDPSVDFTASNYRSAAGRAVANIHSRGKLPFVVGGCTSFMHALVVDRFDPSAEPVDAKLRFDCCFLWLDVSWPVLAEFVSWQVDRKLESGMFRELADFFRESGGSGRVGLRKAIGVQEFDKYFRKYPPALHGSARPEGSDQARMGAYDEAVRSTKENTLQLARRQTRKIQQLRDAGWDLKRVDATEAFLAVMSGESRLSEIWDEQVVEPSADIVRRFLEE